MRILENTNESASFFVFLLELTAGVTYLENLAVVLDSAGAYAFKGHEMRSNKLTLVASYSLVKPFFPKRCPQGSRRHCLSSQL